ncbi:DNA polymerase III subunit delta [Candidatus Saccharibacteria bacterium]|nr:DNA polymerase III subunit delta [Candidatus Saccharibacteria bacterium]
MIITITGVNNFLISEELKNRTSAFTAEYGEFGYERLFAKDHEYHSLLDRVKTLPFLAEKRLIVLDEPSGNKKLCDNIVDFINSVNEQTELIIVEPKFDKRSLLYKTLKKQTTFNEYIELDEPSLVRWMVDMVTKNGGKLSTSNARLLVQRIGSNQLRINNELKKLICYNPLITSDSINLLTVKTAQSSTFDLLNSVFAGNIKYSLELYNEQRQQKVEPLYIMGLIAWQLYALSIVKNSKGLAVSDIASRAKLNPFVVRKSLDLATKINQSKLINLVSRTLLLDVRLKSEPIDADDAIKELLIEIGSRPDN